MQVLSGGGIALDGILAQKLEYAPGIHDWPSALAKTGPVDADYDTGTKTFRVRATGETMLGAQLAQKEYEIGRKDADGWAMVSPPPNPALELLKCQRYQVVLSRIANASGVGTGHICTAAELEAGKLALHIPVPAHMRNVCPTVTTSGMIRAVYLEPGASGFKSISLTLSPSDYMEISNNMIYISVPTGSSIPVGSIGWVDVLSNGYVLIDCNL